MSMSRSTSDELIAATNLLCEYVERNLPDGYNLNLVMYAGGADLSVETCDGENIEYRSCDEAGIISACDSAQEHSPNPPGGE